MVQRNGLAYSASSQDAERLTWHYEKADIIEYVLVPESFTDVVEIDVRFAFVHADMVFSVAELRPRSYRAVFAGGCAGAGVLQLLARIYVIKHIQAESGPRDFLLLDRQDRYLQK